MTSTHPGNEPDPGDMSPVPEPEPITPDLPEEELEKIGDFA